MLDGWEGRRRARRESSDQAIDCANEDIKAMR